MLKAGQCPAFLSHVQRPRLRPLGASGLLDVCGKHVAAKTHRLQQYGGLRIRLDLLPQTADMNIDTTFDRPRETGMGERKKFLTGYDAAGIAAEGQKQIEFRRRHRNSCIARIMQLATKRIDLPAFEAQLPLNRRINQPIGCAPKQAADTGDDFTGLNGLVI